MSNRQDRPLAKKLLHALGLLALALFLLYVAVQFVLIFHRSYKTETAIRYTLAESLNLTGVVAFDAVDVPGSGNLGYLVQDGERVTNGTVVAECYTDDTQGLQRERLDRLERSITLLTKSQNSAGSELSVLTNQTKQALYNLLDKLDTAQYSGITDADVDAGRAPWLAIDDAIPEHPSVGWRKRHFPKVMPTYFVNSLQVVAEMVAMGMGIGILPTLLAQARDDLVLLRDLPDANTSALWLLTHPESRHLRRIAVVYGHLAQTLRLP